MDFWDVFWLLLIFIPLLLIWAFAVVDIFRRDDLSGWLKALWIVVVILAPFFGTLIYLIFRRPGATPQERQAMDQASRDFVQKYAPTDTAQQLSMLADLHDRGKLTDAEFATEKARVLDAAKAVTPATPTAPGTATSTATSAAGAKPTAPSGA
ncbi:SHOCT domain-containing protein [Catellatospora tritici]|uniref:SHOCT domain-containing protein n=1 Tax=Catellatospora tritici TaxID=2851566 RepID=UPI001C2D10A4|nr:SHOCT domain-containing protein [Catellatospora tritici]MBV1848922.1 SHOCT domain-containing protein [Catellatospora tritici]